MLDFSRYTLLVGTLLVALAASLGISWYLTRRIGHPVELLTQAAGRLSRGDYDARVTVTGGGPELSTLGDTFNTMADRLGDVENTRRRLLSDLAHEMRTPIATLNAHLEGIADGVLTWDDNTQAVVEQQAQRLTRLARDLDEVRGVAGERFAVRNSGAFAVIEGAGDHCCEYMTGGIVTVLGKVGHNFGAGMTGGFAYVLDLDNDFVDHYNHELIELNRISTEAMEEHQEFLSRILDEHIQETGSAWAYKIRNEFDFYSRKFWLVKPKAANLQTLLKTTKADPQ
mgnify:CR=1 FL=1